jgi:hypothetical protein
VDESLSRRGFVLLGGGLLLGGCTATGHSPVRASSPASTGTPSTRPSPMTPNPTASTPAARLPQVHPWHPNPNDVSPEVKRAAVQLVEARGNRRDHALQVIDAQYGGILPASASVLVVCRYWTLDRAGIRSGGATYDVRLQRLGRRWRITAVHPSHPGPPAARLSAPAHQVLASPRIDLPPAARADVLSGRAHDSVLTAMLRLSKKYDVGVSVVRSGHPIHVFGTDRLSDHPRGRAFDTWRINGRAVVDRHTPRALVTGYMRDLAALDAYNVGGPYLLGSAPQYFSDPTHHDHVHAGFLT